MNQTQYVINQRPYTALTSFANEVNPEPKSNYLFDLSYLTLVEVMGVNAASFLQGQLTCDIRPVSNATMQQGALCNLKGRIQALMDVINVQHYQLILPQDLVLETMASLNKVAMLSRVTLKEVTTYKVYGFYLNNSNDLMPTSMQLPQTQYAVTVNDQSYCYSLGANYFIFVIPLTAAADFVEPFMAQQKLWGSLAWHRLQLKRKIIEIYPSTRGLFLPHRLNLHRNGYISFDKGCYKGQEIIARTHYRAKLKHHLETFFIHTSDTPVAGKKLFNPANQQEVGELIDFCPMGEPNHYLIVASILFDNPPQVVIEGQQEAVILKN